MAAFRQAVVFPKQHGQRAGRRRVTQQAERVVDGPDGVEQGAAVLVMHAFQVALGVTRRDESMDGVQRVIAVRLIHQHPVGEPFGAVNLAVFADDFLIPYRTRGEKSLVRDRLEKGGAAEMEAHRPVMRHDGKCEFLGVDGEFVATEGNDIAPAGEEFAAVAELADRIVLQGFQTRLHVIRLDAVAERAELINGVAQLRDHEVAREVTVERIEIIHR